MPRTSSSHTSRSFHATARPLPPPVPKKSLPLPPPVVYMAPPVPTLGQSIKDGFAFGIGSSIARNMVDSVSNTLGNAFRQSPEAPRPFTTETLPQGSMGALYKQCLAAKTSQHCGKLNDLERSEWIQCMKESRFDDRACDSFLKG